ncbi:MAG: DUF493 domain-containing protein [Spirochaetes bacterium]|jgi:putative lipoic acid-binding regulatory protein|nr:DUF493 domain-containing protein [Spirochaetota bacterium]
MNGTSKINGEYPAELTFKSIFKSDPSVPDKIAAAFEEFGISFLIGARESSNGKFISYTITAKFPAEKILTGICDSLSKIDGFMMLF